MSMDWVENELDSIRKAGLIRFRRELQRDNRGRLLFKGRFLHDFSSNDYLGLACHPKVIFSACKAIKRFGAGASASPLVSGYSSLHRKLEHHLATWEGADDSLVFPSGFQANCGVVTALVKPRDVIFADALNHASLIDGCRQSRAVFKIFRHLDSNHLEDLIRRTNCKFGRRWIVSDSVFSMDGDLSRLDELADIAIRHDAMIILDEAHATGVIGAAGKGQTELLEGKKSDWQQYLLKTGTFSKALGSQGGFACGSKSILKLIKNKSRSYIFSTGLNPGSAGAALAALKIVEKEPFRRIRLLEVAGVFAASMPGIKTPEIGKPTPIFPIILKDSLLVMRVARQLLNLGFLVPGIRPPSVPEGSARLRVSLKYGLENDEVISLAGHIRELIKG